MMQKLLAAVALVLLACSQRSLVKRSLTEPETKPPPIRKTNPTKKDLRPQTEIDAAACGWPQHWWCNTPRPKLFMASTLSPIIPNTWTIPHWYVNRLTGNDQNPCTTAISPCATKQEIWVHRLGCGPGSITDCPRFRQTTTLEQDAPDNDNSDPLYAHVALEDGASFIVSGGPTNSTSAIFTRSAAKSRAAGLNSLLQGSFSTGAPVVGTFITNTTSGKASEAWIYNNAGGENWNLTQPLVVNTPSMGPTGVEVDSWNSGDTVSLVSPVAINIVDVSADLADANAGFNNALYLYNLTIYDPESQSDTVGIGSNVFMQDVLSQRFLSFYEAKQTSSNQRILANLFSLASSQSTGGADFDPLFLGGALSGAGGNVFFGDPDFSSDVILGGGGGFTTLYNGGEFHNSSVGGVGTNGSVYLDGLLNLAAGRLEVASAGAVVYGSASGQISLYGSSHLWNTTSETFTERFTAPSLISPGIQINSMSSACSATAAGVVNCGIATTPGNLDATAGASGFGGAAFVFAGASVANF